MNGIDCAETKDKTEIKMGIPFGFKHANAACFFKHSKNTDKKSPKRVRRSEDAKALDKIAQQYSFSFKSLSDIDLPPGDQHHSSYTEKNHNSGLHALGLSGFDASDASSPGGRRRLTEKLVTGLMTEKILETGKVNITKVMP